MKAERRLFGTDGIRGIANKHPITPENIIKIGKAAAHVFKNGKKRTRILIGKDTRISGYILETALTSGICSMGVDVFLVGPLPTPAIAHLTKSLCADAGIVISASHNPAEHNGIKFFSKEGFKLPDKKEMEIEDFVFSEQITEHINGKRLGKAYRIDDAKGRYIEFAKSTIDNADLSGIKIVLDCANGAGYAVAPTIFRELGAEVIVLNNRPNGMNINMDCGALHPEVIRNAVKKEGADIGIALDGDGDRLIIVDEKGEEFDGDFVMALCAQNMKKQNALKGNSIVATQMSNLGLEKFCNENDIKIIRADVGDRYVIKEMRKGNHNLGGEQSGHIILMDYITTGDGIITALQTLNIMKKGGKKLSELRLMKKYPQVLINTNVKEKKDFEKMPKVWEKIKNVEKKLSDNGRVFVRYSGTENIARVMIEGPDQNQITEMAQDIIEEINNEIGVKKIEKSMFREYDIRGRVDDHELNEKSSELIGKGFGTMLKRKGIDDCVIGYDARSYSEMLKNSFMKGLISTGINAHEIGRVISPITYFSQHHLKIRGCAMITASHNPNGWSGFKLGYDFSSTLLPDDIKELYKIIEKGKFEDGKGNIKKIEGIIEAYTKDVLNRSILKRKLKIVINARNGTAGIIVPEILRRGGCEVIEQFCDLDMAFPNGNPNPSLEDMMEELGQKVKENKADAGFAIDGDGDRIGMVDEKGENIYPDRIMIILSRLVLQKNPGAKIVFDVKATQALIEDIEAHGGRPIMWITGHSYIKNKLHTEKAALGGERSGHIFFMDNYYGFDDATFSCLKVLEYVSQENQSVSAIMNSVPRYYTSPVIHAPCPDDVKYDVIEKVISDFKQKFDNVIDVNGARVVFEDGWALVRPSSNLPVMVIVFEAKSPERLKEIEKMFRNELGRFPEISKEWKNG